MFESVGIDMLMSVSSLTMTAYFWLIKARKDLPNLEFFQLSNFRVVSRRHPDDKEQKRICIQQLDTGGVLAVNHSTRQNSIVFFECYLKTDQGEILGDWGYSGDDKPPWNIGPETTISLSPACFFDVPADFETPEDPEFRLQFITASGRKFSHRFRKHAPRLASADSRPQKQAA